MWWADERRNIRMDEICVIANKKKSISTKWCLHLNVIECISLIEFACFWWQWKKKRKRTKVKLEVRKTSSKWFYVWTLLHHACFRLELMQKNPDAIFYYFHLQIKSVKSIYFIGFLASSCERRCAVQKFCCWLTEIGKKSVCQMKSIQ